MTGQQFVDNRVVMIKLIPPYDVPEGCAVYYTDSVEYALRLFSMSHAQRPKLVWQDFTNHRIYIPEVADD